MSSEATLIAESKINQILRELTEQTGATRVQLSDHTKLGAGDFDIKIELAMPIVDPKTGRIASNFFGRRGLR